MKGRDDSQASDFLNGWKEIANYMGKGVRTVQRYENELGLPVRRPAGKNGASVIATRAEIDAWVKAAPIHAAFPLTQVGSDPRLLLTIRGSIAEMHQLREQTAALRGELRAALHQLRATVMGLHGRTQAEPAQQIPWRRKPN